MANFGDCTHCHQPLAPTEFWGIYIHATGRIGCGEPGADGQTLAEPANLLPSERKSLAQRQLIWQQVDPKNCYKAPAEHLRELQESSIG